MVKVSIITPAYNAEKYISKCISSILQQELKEIEHIIVDDGSTDRTAKICEQYAKDNKKIKVIYKKNEGVSKARNEALKIAKGEYILFADADDWLEKDMCSKMVKLADKNKLDIAISGYYNYYDNIGDKKEIKLKKIENKSFPQIITDDKNKYGGFPWNKLIRREKIKKFFNENIHYYENLMFFLENFGENTKFDVIYEPLYNYCINDNSAVHYKRI